MPMPQMPIEEKRSSLEMIGKAIIREIPLAVAAADDDDRANALTGQMVHFLDTIRVTPVTPLEEVMRHQTPGSGSPE